jgi:hypothetical protein
MYKYQKEDMANYTREEFVYNDGGTITLDWAFAIDSEDSKGVDSPL